MRRRQLIPNAAFLGAGPTIAIACARPTRQGSAPAESATTTASGGVMAS